MLLKIFHTLVCFIFMYVLAFEDINVYGQNQDMLETGREQYQLLQERGKLPRYGNCWKSAVTHVDDGCRNLSEETQSDIALHLTNCFLEMSGHPTYNCELDKKPNLRGICINSMTDRAFNVYTEFYTHTQNMCWFLRGQIWHETINENTKRVTEQLEINARTQEKLLKMQEESLEVQEKVLKHGLLLEKVLEGLYLASENHQEILKLISQSVGNLQAWLIGEISWFDFIIFYVSCSFLIIFFTSTAHTAPCRFILIILLGLNALFERLIYNFTIISTVEKTANVLSTNFYIYVWFCRYIFIFLSLIILIISALRYKDYSKVNNVLLEEIHKQNISIKEALVKMNPSNVSKSELTYELNKSDFIKSRSPLRVHLNDYSSSNCNLNNGTTNFHKQKSLLLNGYENGRYNLRSRQGTPDSNNSKV